MTARVIIGIYDFFRERKSLFYATTILAFAALVWLASGIKIEEDITNILPNGKQARDINDILKQSGFADRIIVKLKISSENEPERLTEAAELFSTRLLSDSSVPVAELKIRVEEDNALEVYEAVYRNLPYYLSPSDYTIIDSLIAPSTVSHRMESNYNTLISAQGFFMKRLIADDPVGIVPLALKKLEQLQLDNNYELYDGYMMDKDKKSLFMFITPRYSANETGKNAQLIDTLYAIKQALQNSKVEMLYYGGPVVGVSNARQLKADTLLTLSITVVCLLLLTLIFFKRKRVPFIMMLPVVFGALFALAFIQILKGSISSIALGAGSIVLGIAINYAIHFFSHLKHCGTVRQTIAELLQPMTIGSFTTVGSFFSLTLLHSPILNDFGLFAGLSLTGATIFSLIFLPHFTSDKKSHQYEHEPSFIQKWLNVNIPHKGKVFLAIMVLTVFFYQYAGKVSFDSDMNHYSYLDEELQLAQREIDLMQDDSSKTIYVATSGTGRIAVLEKNEEILGTIDKGRKRGSVIRYSSIGWFLPSEKLQQEKLQQWKSYWTKERTASLQTALNEEGEKYGFNANAFSSFINKIENEPSGISEEDISVIRNSVGSQLLISSKGNEVVLNAVKVNKENREDFYQELHNQRAIVLDKQIITNALVETLYSDFNQILLYTALLVFISLLVSYASLELTLITFLPMLITWIWILGIMALVGLQFNLINIIISTFIFGLGDDFSIFTTDGLMKKYAEGKATISSHRVSIVLCAATTIIGLGALIFAKHPALRSIAAISIIGILCVVVIGQTVQPFIFNALIQNRKERGLPPYTLSSLALTVIAFTYYVLGSLLLTFIGYILVYALPFIPIKTKKLWLHHLMRACLWGLTYVMVNVRKTHEGKSLMNFDKPAIIIANHQSFLDILVTVMQHPKLILLTNHWVYYSPVFGKVVQLADYYPVMEGAEPAIDKFSDIVKDGYSIVVFPEGTRSADRKLKRFHKGAFYLAEKLQLDIVPMVLHGTGDTIRKGDFMVMNSSMTMKFLPRIEPEDKSFGTGYAERTKQISRYFKTEYEKLKVKKETPEYFRQQLRLNYTYKGPAPMWHALKYTFKADGFKQLNNLIPRKASVAVLGCSYGYTAYMLSLLSDERIITGYDKDEERISVAENGYLKHEGIRFGQADVINLAFPMCDVFVVNKSVVNSVKQEEKFLFFEKLRKCLNADGRIVLFDGSVSEVI